ncbi:MAG: RecQ family ATP-dependent DNA helicase [Planctomycetota bacterium]
MEPIEILQTLFGYPDFRNRQREIIERVLRGQHCLVIMPTGMGKSLCFQVPAIHLAQQTRLQTDKPPLTLVISPLIALMKDQVDALVQKEVSAAFVNSSLTREERLDRYRRINQGEYDLLYVTPERFRKPDFCQIIANRKIVLMAVDEAHCISEWGHDFRPDYTRVGEIRTQIGSPTTIALTATATPDVQADIVRQLNLQPETVELFHAGIDRPNLSLDVMQVWDDSAKLEIVVETRKKIAGSGIVYFTLIRKLMEFSSLLWDQNIPHLIYHGDLPRVRRKALQDSFMKEDGHLVLATNAFGMGIDKQDIRLILHADMPGSLEAYYQEIGRAGRDGLKSICLLMYDERDLATQMEFMQWSNPDAEFYRRVHDYLKYDTEQVNSFGLDWLRDKLVHKQKHDRRLETALAMLKRWAVIQGTINPLRIDQVFDLPDQLKDEQALNAKRKRDQTKLLSMLNYVKYTGDRRHFLLDYFGLSPTK